MVSTIRSFETSNTRQYLRAIRSSWLHHRSSGWSLDTQSELFLRLCTPYLIKECVLNRYLNQIRGPNSSGGMSNPAAGHSLERAWPIIFSCSDPKMADECGDDVFDKEKCQCLDYWGSIELDGGEIGHRFFGLVYILVIAWIEFASRSLPRSVSPYLGVAEDFIDQRLAEGKFSPRKLLPKLTSIIITPCKPKAYTVSYP